MIVCLFQQQQQVLELMYTCVLQVQELSKALDSATEEIQQLQAELQDTTKMTSAERKQVRCHMWRKVEAAELRLHVEACRCLPLCW